METDREIRLLVASNLIAELFTPETDDPYGLPVIFEETARTYLDPQKFSEHIQGLAKSGTEIEIYAEFRTAVDYLNRYKDEIANTSPDRYELPDGSYTGAFGLCLYTLTELAKLYCTKIYKQLKRAERKRHGIPEGSAATITEEPAGSVAAAVEGPRHDVPTDWPEMLRTDKAIKLAYELEKLGYLNEDWQPGPKLHKKSSGDLNGTRATYIAQQFKNYLKKGQSYSPEFTDFWKLEKGVIGHGKISQAKPDPKIDEIHRNLNRQ